MVSVRRRVSALGGVFGCLCWLAISPGTSTAAGYECGTLYNTYTYGTGVEWDPAPSGHIARGTAGTLTVRPSDLCSEDARASNFTGSWTMIAAADGIGYAQSGFEKAGLSGTLDFAAWWDGGSGRQWLVYGTAHRFGGDQVRYKQAWTAASANCQFNDCITMYAAGNALGATVFNPLNYWQAALSSPICCGGSVQSQ